MINLLSVADNSNITMEIIPGNESVMRQYTMIKELPFYKKGGRHLFVKRPFVWDG